MPEIEIDVATDRYLEFAASVAGLTKGQVVARLVEQVQAMARGAAEVKGEEGGPIKIHADYAGHRTSAVFVPGPGRIEISAGPLAGQTFRSPSEAARKVVEHRRPGVSPHRNGWSFWIVSATGAPLQSLRHLAS